MKQLFLTLFLTLCSITGFAQMEPHFFAYYNEDSTLTGFRDAQGRKLTEPKFVMVGCNSFETVVAVVEQVTEDDYSTYYLRNNGSKFGVDSVYFSDATADTETNYFIRFRSPKTEKVGLMDLYGRIVFPAVYDDMKKVRSDFVWALRGAKKAYWKDDNGKAHDRDCEHYSWVGGKSQLLFIEGNVVCDNFLRDKKGNFLDLNLDYSTFESSKKPSTDSLRVNFKAKGGGYISFEDFDKVFEKWFLESFLKNPSEKQMQQFSSDSLVIWEEEQGWVTISKQDFYDQESANLRPLIQSIQTNNYDWTSYYEEDFYLYELARFAPYFNGCYEFNSQEHPCHTVSITNKSTGQQSSLTFLKTAKGWELVSITLR